MQTQIEGHAFKNMSRSQNTKKKKSEEVFRLKEINET